MGVATSEATHPWGKSDTERGLGGSTRAVAMEALFVDKEDTSEGAVQEERAVFIGAAGRSGEEAHSFLVLPL